MEDVVYSQSQNETLNSFRPIHLSSDLSSEPYIPPYIILNENHFYSKTARAAEIFDFFLVSLNEPCHNSTGSLS